jgi:hypothetical protein
VRPGVQVLVTSLSSTAWDVNWKGVPAFNSEVETVVVGAGLDILKLGFAARFQGGCSSGNSSDEVDSESVDEVVSSCLGRGSDGFADLVPSISGCNGS